MSSKSSPSSSGSRSENLNASPESPTKNNKEILSVIEALKRQVAIERRVSIKDRVGANRQKLVGVTNHIYKLSSERSNGWISVSDGSVDLLSKRQREVIGAHIASESSNGDSDYYGFQEDCLGTSAVVLGSSALAKNAVRHVKLPEVKQLPPYTTWIFLDRNQRMTEDQSVVGRRRIYYDQNGAEALICSDSEEELIDDEEEKRDFAESEDYILR